LSGFDSRRKNAVVHLRPSPPASSTFSNPARLTSRFLLVAAGKYPTVARKGAEYVDAFPDRPELA
jgi:hypothetical protein